MFNQSLLVKRLDPQAQVINISRHDTWGGPTIPAEAAIDGDEIDHGRACANVNEAQVVSSLYNMATEHVAIKGD